MASNLTKLFEFFSLIGQLKRVQRTGWVLHKVSDPESVADHMYRMAMMSFLVEPSSGLSKERCIKLSLVHDLAESIVGDIAPADGVDKDDKYKREKTAMSHISTLVSEEIGSELMSLWLEYEEEKTAEAKFVKDLDKFDMIFQAYEYEQLENKPGFLQEFFDSTEGKFRTETVQTWVTELDRLRNQSSPLRGHSSPHTRDFGQSSSKRESARVKPFIHGE
ncbi:5'-deoxynucleotidase HDDC2-like [Ruditapes philippinarum]|uniref:5'-deoxynucleotidase HDDC2-like n=1 Tax=Ruditapes philippinarum TaxID=129788 RepID=UPI00295B4516|nr:5'-deoxynucleotidase HDDC2-like [Ruditapes philippinarum]